MRNKKFGKVILTGLIMIFGIGLAQAQQASLDKQKDRIAKLLGKKSIPIAIIQPTGNAEWMKPIETAAKEIGINLVILTPEQMGDLNVFNPKSYPVILYTAAEQCARLYKDEDLGEFFIKYMSGGGILISIGQCFPFYYASNWDENAKKWIDGEPIQFGKEIGLFVASGFEEPPKGTGLYLEHNPGDNFFSSLPKEFPYPQKGDLRLRLTSEEAQEEEGGKYTAVLTVKSKEGENFGEVISIIQRPIEFKKTTIIYVWGSLLGTEYGKGIIADAFVYALEQIK